MAIKFNSKKHSVFDFLTFEYSLLDKGFLMEEEKFSEEEINTLEKGLEMEEQGWGFLEHKNCVLFKGKQNNPKERNYFIVTPYEQIIPTDKIFSIRLKFGDPQSILYADAGNYFGICKQFLDETAFERAGSF